MRCKYRFSVHGRIRLSATLPLICRGVTYELVRNSGGVIEAIDATVSVPNPDEWPKSTPSPQPGVHLGIHVSSPQLPFIQVELRVVEGLLSLYGLEGIDVENPAQSWHPDTEDEKKSLHIFSFSHSLQHLSDNELYPAPFDLVARSFLAALSAKDIELPLSFFRKGRIDSRERRYIEAFYDYYFVLETVYAEGKSRNNAVKDAMKGNAELLALVKKALTDELLIDMMKREPKLKAAFDKSYANKSASEVIDHLVEIRGFLHHHNAKRPGIWHPEDHKRFEIDALLIERIAFAVVFALSEPFIFSEETILAYQQAVLRANAGA